MPQVSCIAAIDAESGIGYKGDLPWPSQRSDLRKFKGLTKGKPVVVGRKTFESITTDLDGRLTIVMSKSRDVENKLTYSSKDELISDFWKQSEPFSRYEDELMIAGGEEIYRLFWKFVSTIYLTVFHEHTFDADTHFPVSIEQLKESSRWEVHEGEPIREDGDLPQKWYQVNRKVFDLPYQAPEI